MPKLTAVLHKIAAMKSDTNKVIAYFSTESDAIYHSDDAPKIYAAAIDLAKKLNFSRGIISLNLILSGWYSSRADYIKALDFARQASAVAQSSSKQYVPNTLSFIRQIYRGLQDFEKAVEYDNRALKICRQMRNDTLICYTYIALANDYGDLKKYQVALTYDQKAMPIVERLKIADLKATVYSETGWVYYSLKDYLPAFKYSQMSLQLVGETNQSAVPTLGTLGEIYRDTPDSLLMKMGVTPGQRAQKVLECFKKSLAGAKKSGIMTSMTDNYLDISKSYASLGDYREAYGAYRNYILYRDSAANEKQQKSIIQQEARSREEAMAYQQQLASIKARQQRNYYIGGIAVLLLILFIASRSYINQRKSNHLLSAANTQISFEKSRSEDLLLNILPADVAEELKEKGSANARLFEEVTVLFTDFVNFTIVSELLTPQQLVDELNVCFKAFDHIMTVHGIEKIKTIGDAYLAVAGLPHADVNHAAKAVNAAIEIGQFMRQRKAAFGDNTFEIRIGIHSGSVVAGIVGLKKFAYDIWGDTVNTAARMEQNSEPGKINISEKTRELLRDQFSLIYRGELEAKNKGLLKMYFVNV